MLHFIIELANVRIVGRKKDLIIRGGENIYPREIEEILFTHPKVLNVAVVGYPDPRLGERTCACIIPKAGENISLEEIVAFLRGKIAVFKLPERIKVMDSFPTTTSGKVMKNLLKKQVVD